MGKRAGETAAPLAPRGTLWPRPKPWASSSSASVTLGVTSLTSQRLAPGRQLSLLSSALQSIPPGRRGLLQGRHHPSPLPPVDPLWAPPALESWGRAQPSFASSGDTCRRLLPRACRSLPSTCLRAQRPVPPRARSKCPPGGSGPRWERSSPRSPSQALCARTVRGAEGSSPPTPVAPACRRRKHGVVGLPGLPPLVLAVWPRARDSGPGPWARGISSLRARRPQQAVLVGHAPPSSGGRAVGTGRCPGDSEAPAPDGSRTRARFRPAARDPSAPEVRTCCQASGTLRSSRFSPRPRRTHSLWLLRAGQRWALSRVQRWAWTAG